MSTTSSSTVSLAPDILQTNITSDHSISIASLIAQSDSLVKIILFVLLLMSIWSWAVIFYKIIQFYKMNNKINMFEKFFWSGQVLEQLYDGSKRFDSNPLSSIFIDVMDECRHGYKRDGSISEIHKASQKERISYVMTLAHNKITEILEAHLGFLAIAASSAPFIGLFGTVWGIMHSFQSIAASKNTSLAVVAPGIAEALLVTAAGLFVAICGYISYNYLSSYLAKINNRIENFNIELSALMSKVIDEDKLR